MRRRHLNAGAAFMLVLMTAVATYIITFYVSAQYYNDRFGDLHALEQRYSKFREVSDVIEKNFIAEYDFEAAMDSAMAGFVDGLGDKWSGFYTAKQTRAMVEASENAYVGVGVTIDGGSENPFRITQVSRDGPADQAGVMPLDVITHVDGVAVADIGSQEDVVARVRGAAGTTVRLTVRREGQSLDFDIKRASVFYEQVSARMLEPGVGYIAIAGFERHVDEEFNEKLSGLIAQGARGLVLDVRMNGGGMVDVMVGTLDPLLPEGIVISLVDNQGTAYPYNSDAACLDIPMVVLINEYSISAAEFFAAALQEYGVAQVVGTPTGGKGYAQQTYTLSDGSSVNLSVMRYYTPKGNSLIDTGVTPDHEIDLTDEAFYNFYSLTDEQDDQLQKALSVLRQSLPELPEEAEEAGEGAGEAESEAEGAGEAQTTAPAAG